MRYKPYTKGENKDSYPLNFKRPCSYVVTKVYKLINIIVALPWPICNEISASISLKQTKLSKVPLLKIKS